jgi:flavodoxin
VAGAGDVDGDGYADVVVGARYYDSGEADEGAAFVFLGGAAGIPDGNPNTAASQLEADQADAWLGISVAGAGDVDGDGYADVVVGAATYDAGETDEGAAFVFLGSAAGILDADPAAAATQIESNQAGAWLGWSVAGAGDLNGDGYGDIIVGASDYDAGETDEGAAFVFLGSAAGIPDGDPTSANARLEADQAYAYLGWSVAGAGDLNGDGYGDVIVGAPTYSAGEAEEGTTFVFMGTSFGLPDGNPANAATWLESDQAGCWMGISVAGAGDVDGDGYADVIVGASDYDAGDAYEGAAFVFLGGPTGIPQGDPTTAAAQLESNQADAYMGWSVAGAGDVDGDGYADVIVAASDYDAGETDEGAAFVFLGGASGIIDGNPTTAATQIESDQPYAWLGWSVAGAGDVNGDGYADVIVGASGYDAGKPFEGAAFVFLGSSSGIPSGDPLTAATQLASSQADASLGMSVAGAGDVNGDGYADVIVGASDYDAGESDEGAAFVFLGNGGAYGRLVLTRQVQGDGSSAPVEPWGGSYALDRFDFEIAATHPMGRSRVRIEAEVCPPSVPFLDAACSGYLSPTWVDVTATPGGVLLSQTLSGLEWDTLYRWRARVLYAPFGVTEAGITAPPHPAHGPWRRVSAQAREADLRTVPEPAQLLLLGAGIAGLALIGRGRIKA